ncbi:MAG: sigma-54-dependent transcriptional regulator [Planctomycetota bacterium]
MTAPPEPAAAAPHPLKVLVVDDEESMRHFLARGLRRLGHDVQVAADGSAALATWSQQPFDVTVLDLRMPGLDGLTVLTRLRALDPGATVVLMTAHGNVQDAVEAMKLGAADFVQKPFELDELCMRLARAAELREALQENRDLRQLLGRDDESGLVTHSPAMRALRHELELLRGSDATVLLRGESGTGKTLLARAIHRGSARRDGPFVVANCPAIPETLFESALFGHEVGAFTGATEAKPGLCARATGGTLFLDEIGELSVPAQAKLERLLQDREYTPLGAQQSRRADVRFVAATNRDLARAAEQGTFRQELLWRLRVVELHVPPLRERREDVPVLVLARLRQLAARGGGAPKSVTADALAMLAAYDWPGNVRELENLTERMAVLAGDRELLGTGDLPSEVRDLAPIGGEVGDYEAARRRFDRAYFQALLVRCGGSITQAAQQAGISRGHLHRRLRELQIGADSARGIEAPSERDGDRTGA